MTSSCSHAPPPDFAPDPGLVSRIREIRISAPPRACPGNQFFVSYSALLDDGTAVPFATRYDKDRPPRLHVVFLERTSFEADALGDGSWRPDPDPLRSAVRGFRLHVALKAKPSVVDSVVVEPDYGCLRHAFGFEGYPGRTGEPGGDGPDVTVRLGIVRSPFYERLLIAGIEVGEAPPFYVLADANLIPPRDWLIVESYGGKGSRGVAGEAGAAGTPGRSGCPGGQGGQGGRGGNGGPGGAGGRGGRVTIIAPAEEPFLAGIVDAQSPGGRGGPGGPGGKGGDGGLGGEPVVSSSQQQCQRGPKGPSGEPGRPGTPGPVGSDGPRPHVLTVPTRDVFGTRIPLELDELLHGRRR